MYWTNTLSMARIESAAMDGTERTTLFNVGLGHPVALTIDKKSGKLFWADTELKRIESSDLEGGNREVLLDGLTGNPRGLATFGNFLYWLDRGNQLVERIHKSRGDKRSWVRGRIPGLSDLISVEHSLREQSHPCSRGNGGCSHLCLAKGNSEFRCSCPLSLELRSDEVTCADPPTCPPDHFTCRSGDIRCIPRVWRCDRLPECEDNSDEEDCPRCDPRSEFQCTSGQCIPARLHCDGMRQCNDGSDEEQCCRQGQHRCLNHQCIDEALVCNGRHDCSDKSDEENCSQAGANVGQPNATHYAIAIVVGLVFLVLVVALVFVCRRKTSHVPLEDVDLMVIKKPLNPNADQPTPANTLSSSRGKSAGPGLSMGSGSGPPLYDRTHVTGASSSSSTVTHYPKETLNPPPSPVTDRSVYAEDCYYSSNSLSTVRSCRQYKAHFTKAHKMRKHIPPPPTSPCSTDVCEDSEPYTAAAAKKYYFNNSVMELGYDSDPYPPPPTPRSHYFSDEMSCPPSPSTERSFFNPYPPPPSPVGTSECWQQKASIHVNFI